MAARNSRARARRRDDPGCTGECPGGGGLLHGARARQLRFHNMQPTSAAGCLPGTTFEPLLLDLCLRWQWPKRSSSPRRAGGYLWLPRGELSWIPFPDDSASFRTLEDLGCCHVGFDSAVLSRCRRAFFELPSSSSRFSALIRWWSVQPCILHRRCRLCSIGAGSEGLRAHLVRPCRLRPPLSDHQVGDVCTVSYGGTLHRRAEGREVGPRGAGMTLSLWLAGVRLLFQFPRARVLNLVPRCVAIS